MRSKKNILRLTVLLRLITTEKKSQFVNSEIELCSRKKKLSARMNFDREQTSDNDDSPRVSFSNFF